MQHMNLENLTLPSSTFDIVVCYHVLDYLTNDLKGMSELHRVLKDDGIAITQEGIDYKSSSSVEWPEALPENEYRIRQYGIDFFIKWKSVDFDFILLGREGSFSPVMISAKKYNHAGLMALQVLLLNSGYKIIDTISE